MSSVRVIINNKKNIKDKVCTRYRELFQGWKRENPDSKAYTRTQMKSNINKVMSVDSEEFNEYQFKKAKITKWNGRYVLPFAHWYFLVQFQNDLFGNKYAIIEDACYEGDYHNDVMTTKPYGENKLYNAQLFVENKDANSLKHPIKTSKNIIRLTESQFKQMLSECIFDILNEEKGKKKIGDYTALDGQWWDGLPHGLEHKGLVQDVRMYDRLHKDGTIDTIGLFRRCDNRKFFYARIIPIKDSKETKWKVIKTSDVPQIILNDFKTINPQGHEPYLPF